ncbi:MAG: hypothetical protein WDZ48_05190 [Pirellulales bacterium]
MRAQIRFFTVATALSIACSFSAQASGEDSTAPVRAAVGSVDSWLGAGKNQEAWATYLNLASLRAELAKGDKADPAAVETVHKQLASGAAGLELPQFARLRDAVAMWVGELKIAQAPSLEEAVLSAEATFRPITDADVATSKNALESAAANLNRFLSGANGAAWKKYLSWHDLEQQLKSATPNLEVLAAVHQKLISDQPGLEMRVFAGVADALDRYVNDLAGHDDALRARFAEQLKGLADALAQYAKNPNDDTAIAVGGRLGWLENMRQAGPLLRVVRNRHSQPNLQVAASAKLVGAGIAQKLDEETPVRDSILGTDIHGTGHTVGKVTVELVPSSDRATFDTMLGGTVQSRTVGYNGPATIHARGATSIAGRKRIVIDAHGFASYPATAAANTRTQITGIGGRNLVQRVAWKRVGEQKSQAERIAADHAAVRVRGRMDEQVGEQLSKAQGDYLRKVRDPLVRQRAFPSLKFSTTKELLLVTALAANRNQIAASSAPPEVTVQNDLAVQVHESMINNLTSAMLSGRTLTEEEVQKRVIEMQGSLPDSLKSEQDRDPWSITFARSQPVTVKFADGGIQITIRGQRFTSGDRDFRAMNVTAAYKFQIDGPGIKLVRQGDLTIVPPGEPRRLSGKEITLRTLLEKRFGKLFEPEVKYDGLILPGRWREAGILDLKQATADKGWFVLAWIESGVPAPPEKEKPQQEKQDRVTRAPR